MSKRRLPASAKVLSQVTQLSVAVPQVVAHRVGRLTAAGPMPSARDRQEFVDMVMEKPVAFTQSLQAMWMAGFMANHNLWMAWSRTLFQPPWLAPSASKGLIKQAHRAGLSVLSEGLAPLQRKASANARRLGRVRRR